MADHGNHTAEERAAAVVINPMDMRRKAQIVKGGATDHTGEVVVASVPVDMKKTIFRTLTGCLEMKVQGSRVGVLPHWPDKFVHKYEAAYLQIPRAPDHDKALMDFFVNDADLSMEHADGSFMDHLQFCYEYSYHHFKGHSPRVLLLHSMLGVGTNYFPLKAEQVPKFKALLTEDEFKQIEAFPSILRLWGVGPLADELGSYDKKKLDTLESIEFFRVLDNAPLELTADEFWVAMNFQLIHQLDFLPSNDWERDRGDNFLYQIREQHAILTKAGKMMCKVDLNLKPDFKNLAVQTKVGGTLGDMIRKCTPPGMLIKRTRQQFGKFSAMINHDLSYKLKWRS